MSRFLLLEPQNFCILKDMLFRYWDAFQHIKSPYSLVPKIDKTNKNLNMSHLPLQENLEQRLQVECFLLKYWDM